MRTKCKICAYEAGLFNLTNGICKTCAKKDLKEIDLSAHIGNSEYSDTLEKSDQTTDYSKVPWFRKRITFSLLFLFLTPISLFVMWSGDVYSNKKDENGKLIVMQSSHKMILTSVILFMFFRIFLMPY